MTNAERFDDRADDYVRYRPSYPADAIDAVLEGLGDPASLVCADVGAGTGISARLLADRGCRVFAIEPNAVMRDAAQPHERIEWRDAAGESTGLDDDSVDLVLCAQSYHWMDPALACAEFGRVLRPGGRLALAWNDADESTPLAKGYNDAVRAVSTEGKLMHKATALDPEIREPFPELRRLEFRHAHTVDADALVGRALSASYVPKSGEQHDWVVARLRELHAEHADNGIAPMWYRVWVYLTERP